MCFFGSSKGVSAYTQTADKEKEETAKAKARLLETEGGNKGSELNQSQGRSVRRIFT